MIDTQANHTNLVNIGSNRNWKYVHQGQSALVLHTHTHTHTHTQSRTYPFLKPPAAMPCGKIS